MTVYDNASEMHNKYLETYFDQYMVLSCNKKYRSSNPKGFLGKCVLNICSKFTGEHPCQSAISIKFLCNFIEIVLWHGCSPVNLLHSLRTPFPKNTSGRLLLKKGKLGNKYDPIHSFPKTYW